MLKHLDVKKGDRVAIYMPLVPELAVAMLACAQHCVRRLQRGIRGDTTTLADPGVVAKLKANYEDRE